MRIDEMSDATRLLFLGIERGDEFIYILDLITGIVKSWLSLVGAVQTDCLNQRGTFIYHLASQN